eukprot:gene11414-biopygen2018
MIAYSINPESVRQTSTAPHGTAHTAHGAARRRTALPTRQTAPHGAARRAPHGKTAPHGVPHGNTVPHGAPHGPVRRPLFASSTASSMKCVAHSAVFKSPLYFARYFGASPHVLSPQCNVVIGNGIILYNSSSTFAKCYEAPQGLTTSAEQNHSFRMLRNSTRLKTP